MIYLFFNNSKQKRNKSEKENCKIKVDKTSKEKTRSEEDLRKELST